MNFLTVLRLYFEFKDAKNMEEKLKKQKLKEEIRKK